MKWFCGWLIILLLISNIACTTSVQTDNTAQEVPLPVLNVYITENAKQYTAVHALQDDSIRSRLEEKLHIQIKLINFFLPDGEDNVSEITFQGVMLTEDPKWILPLVERSQLMEIGENQTETGYKLGQYRGKKYGYIFADSYSGRIHPVLVVDPDALKQLGLENIPFTADSMADALEKLSDFYKVPLAVYGSPAQEGFSVLLELFEISPTGGREFYVEDGQVKFDKMTEKAEDYLIYVNRLYQKGYIPSDCLILSKYSGIEMLTYGKSAMAVFPSEEIARKSIQNAEKMGRHIALVELPVDDSCTETNIYAYLTGLISADCEDAELAKRFLVELQSVSKEVQTEGKSAISTEWYPLFADTESHRDMAFDPVEACLPDMRRLYEKHTLDTDYIDPYFSRLATGDIPLSQISEMREQWLMAHGEEYSHSTSGRDLMKLFNSWYFAQTDTN